MILPLLQLSEILSPNSLSTFSQSLRLWSLYLTVDISQTRHPLDFTISNAKVLYYQWLACKFSYEFIFGERRARVDFKGLMDFESQWRIVCFAPWISPRRSSIGWQKISDVLLAWKHTIQNHLKAQTPQCRLNAMAIIIIAVNPLSHGICRWCLGLRRRKMNQLTWDPFPPTWIQCHTMNPQ